MATTTPNFGWSVPTSTDLVKDGATAIETLGDSIDASLVDLKGGTTGQVLAKASNTDMDFNWVAQDDSNAIQNALLTTTGDTIFASSASTPARRAIGTTGQVLTVSGGVPVWATPASASLTWSLKSSTALTGASTITVSSLSSKAYMILANPTAPASSVFTLRFNGDTGSNYGSIGFNYQGDNSYSNGVFNGGGNNTGNTSIRLATKSSDANAFAAGGLTIWAADTTGIKPYQSVFGVNAQGAAGAIGRIDQGNYSGTSAITSISIISSAGNFTGGNIHVYGAD